MNDTEAKAAAIKDVAQQAVDQWRELEPLLQQMQHTISVLRGIVGSRREVPPDNPYLPRTEGR